jgi:hypothetical protein
VDSLCPHHAAQLLTLVTVAASALGSLQVLAAAQVSLEDICNMRAEASRRNTASALSTGHETL